MTQQIVPLTVSSSDMLFDSILPHSLVYLAQSITNSPRSTTPLPALTRPFTSAKMAALAAVTSFYETFICSKMAAVVCWLCL